MKKITNLRQNRFVYKKKSTLKNSIKSHECVNATDYDNILENSNLFIFFALIDNWK